MTGPTVDPPGRDSFVHEARRRQLVESAIAVIDELGADRASVVKIVARAGVSRGVAAYHFRDLDDLHDAVVQHVYALGAAVLSTTVSSAPTARESLLAFVGGSVGFYAAHPREISALRKIFATAGHRRPDTREHNRETDAVERILRTGRRGGEFRAFDVPVMVAIIRAVLDAAAARVAVAPDTTDVVRREVVTAVDAITRSETP